MNLRHVSQALSQAHPCPNIHVVLIVIAILPIFVFVILIVHVDRLGIGRRSGTSRRARLALVVVSPARDREVGVDVGALVITNRCTPKRRPKMSAKNISENSFVTAATPGSSPAAMRSVSSRTATARSSPATPMGTSRCSQRVQRTRRHLGRLVPFRKYIPEKIRKAHMKARRLVELAVSVGLERSW